CDAALDVHRVDALLLEVLRHAGAAAADVAHHVEFIGLGKLALTLHELRHRNVHGTLEVPSGPLLVLTNIDHDNVAVLSSFGQVCHGDLLHSSIFTSSVCGSHENRSVFVVIEPGSEPGSLRLVDVDETGGVLADTMVE